MQNDIWRIPGPERAATVASLVGSGTRYPAEITEPGGGGKFAPDGTVLPFPGNTFICPIDPDSAFFAALCAMQDRLKASAWADFYSLLPKSSLHMTIFCGVSGVPPGVDGWPAGIPAGASLETVTQEFERRTARLACPSGFIVRPRSLRPNSIRMEAVNDTENTRLRNTRDLLRDATGLHRAGHATYEFHISLAYLVRWMSRAEAEALVTFSEQGFNKHLRPFSQVNLGPPELCTFKTMHHFVRARVRCPD